MDISVDARDLMTDNTFEIQKISISYKKSRYYDVRRPAPFLHFLREMILYPMFVAELIPFWCAVKKINAPWLNKHVHVKLLIS